MSIKTQHLVGSDRSHPLTQVNDPATVERLFEEHLPLVRRLCWRFRYSGVPMEDLVQVGAIGLLKAVGKYDPSRGTSLTALAVPTIVGAIKNYFRDHGWAVKVPRKLQVQTQAVHRAVEILTHRLGSSPTIREIAEATGLSEEEIYDTFEVDTYRVPVSLEGDSSGGSSDIPTVLDRIGYEDPALVGLADRIDLTNSLSCLDERERTIVSLKFYSGLSQTEIAERMGLSQMHVSRLQRGALEKLRLALTGDGHHG